MSTTSTLSTTSARRLLAIVLAAALAPAFAGVGTAAAATSQNTTVTGVRIGSHPTYDRVVVDLTGPMPNWSVRYVPKIVQDGSGKTLPMRGTAFLRIMLQPATGHTVSRTPIYASFPTLREVRLAGDFEGYVSFGVGLSHKVAVHSFTLTSPNRLVVDVSH